MEPPADPDAYAYRAASIYWKELPVGRREWKEVARQLGIPLTDVREKDIAKVNQVGRIVRRWEERGLIRHLVLHPDSEAAKRPERVPALEEALRRLFPLRYAAVCDLPAIPDEDERARDDRIHELLGRWGGRILNVTLRGNDVVGTGGGRGPYATVRNAEFNPRVAYPEKVVSLTGWMNPTHWKEGSTTPLDADRVAGELANILDIDVERLRRNIVRTKGEPGISTEKVTFAVTGVGALAGGHRLLHHRKHSELTEIRDDLDKLSSLISKVEGEADQATIKPIHHWVGDLCNRLFVCVPPDVKRPPRDKLRSLEAHVAGLNKKLLSPTLDDMRDICRRGAVMTVGGGRHKSIPIWHLLRQERPIISHLIIDRESAEHIVELESRTTARGVSPGWVDQSSTE